MKAVGCLQDLKAQLIEAGFEIEESLGWYVVTAHGKWTMAHGDVYLNGAIIQKITDAVVVKKLAKSKKDKAKEPIKEIVKVEKVKPTKEIKKVKVEEKPKLEENPKKDVPKSLDNKSSILEKYKKIAKNKKIKQG